MRPTGLDSNGMSVYMRVWGLKITYFQIIWSYGIYVSIRPSDQGRIQDFGKEGVRVTVKY